MTKIRCTNCESIGHVEAYCVYPNFAPARAALSDRQKDALYQEFFQFPSAPLQGEVTDEEFGLMSETLAGAKCLANLALSDVRDAIEAEIEQFMSGFRSRR